MSISTTDPIAEMIVWVNLIVNLAFALILFLRLKKVRSLMSWTFQSYRNGIALVVLWSSMFLSLLLIAIGQGQISLLPEILIRLPFAWFPLVPVILLVWTKKMKTLDETNEVDNIH